MKSIVFLAALLALPGCVGVAIGSGAAAVGVAASQEGGLRRAATDIAIQAKINDLWFEYDFDTFRKLDMTVDQGRVLITGVVQNPEDRVEAVRLAWQSQGVTQVINEIQVAESKGIVGYAQDTWITTQIRTKITIDSGVQSVNYNIDTVQGNVYLLGVAQTQKELDRVIALSRTTRGVRRVVSYVKLHGEKVSWSEERDASVVPQSEELFEQRPAPVDMQNNETFIFQDGEYQSTGAPTELNRSIVIEREPL